MKLLHKLPVPFLRIWNHHSDSEKNSLPGYISPEQLIFLKKIRHHRQFVFTARILLLILFLLQWELCANAGIVDSFIFSSPSKITLCFLEMLKNRSLFLHIGITLYETFISFILVILLSILAAILLWYSKKLSEILEPYLVVLNSLPKSALAPLLIVWLGATSKTIIIAGMSVAIFGSILNLYTAFINVDQEKIKLIYTLHGNRRHALTKVVLPSSVPAIISNMKVNIGLSLVGVVIGEFLAARRGLGYLIIYGSQVLQLDMLITSILLLCIIAMGLYQLLQFAEHCYKKKV